MFFWKKSADTVPERPVKISSVELRDGQQSLLATRIRTEDMLPILPKMDEVGYECIEMWGGATFDVAIRYLGDDPWDRVREFKKLCKKTSLRMLLRGQNLIGYKQYPDDVVEKFVEPAAFNTNTADSETSTYIFDAAKTREVTALPGGCTEIKPLSELSAVKIKSVFIGGTTGGTLKELAQAASMLKGRKIAYGLRLIVAPADADTYIKAATAGYLTDVLEVGGLVINHCGSPEVQGRIGKTEVMVSNDLENKPGYAGFETSKTYLTSTKAAVEAALLGTLGYKEEAPAEEEKTETRSLTFEGRCWKFGDDIDTDIIIPTQHLNYETMDEIKTHAFEPLRPDLAAKLREGDLIVAGSNFGCGSSREQAAEVLVANGVHCVIAKSFARIFFRNAINNGILLLECQDLADHVKEGDIIQVDLDNQKITADGKT